MNAKNEKLTALMENKVFVAKIAAMEEPEDVQKAFAEEGVDFTLEEINFIAEQIMAGNSEELNEMQLDAVSGGVDPVSATIVVFGLIKIGADIMTEVNKSRKEKGKKTIW